MNDGSGAILRTPHPTSRQQSRRERRGSLSLSDGERTPLTLKSLAPDLSNDKLPIAPKRRSCVSRLAIH